MPHTGGRSVSQVPCPRCLLARRRGGSSGSECRSPFFSRILIPFIGFCYLIGQGRFTPRLSGQVLKLMAPSQQPLTIDAHLPGEPRGGHALGDTAQQLDQVHGIILGALKDGVGENIETASTEFTPIVENRCSIPLVDIAQVHRMPVGTAQTIGMKRGTRKS